MRCTKLADWIATVDGNILSLCIECSRKYKSAYRIMISKKDRDLYQPQCEHFEMGDTNG